MINSNNFQEYLRLLCEKYQRWWKLYTLTNAEYELFDLGVVVQTEEESHQEGFIRHSAEKQTLRLPILDDIRNYATKEHMLLVGQPGAGKSTALARFLLWAAEQARQNSQAPIPVLIELRQYKPPVTNESGVLYLLQDFLEGYGLPLELSDIKKLLFVEKRFLLLIDGLNELSIDKARTDVKRFREKCSNLKIPMVITTRDLCSEASR